MRIWSIHPKYLDSKGLVALWRETLLAKNVLLGLTKGYKKHPQLVRFQKEKDPIKLIDTYLYFVYLNSEKRGFKFKKEKFGEIDTDKKIIVTKGQIDYEFKHLMSKLKTRDPKTYTYFKNEKLIEANPIFKIQEGGIEVWEKTRLF